MAVITVSRLYGGNGAAIAKRIVDRLKYRLLDRELVDMIAKRARVPTATAESFDERGFGGATGFVHSLLWGIQGQLINPETYHLLASRIIREAAAKDDLVVIGRGSQIILAGVPGTFHVQVVSPLDDRIVEIQRRESLDREIAERRIHEVDQARARYVQMIGGRKWDDPTLYDLIVNTHRLSPEEAAGLIVDAARAAGVLQPVAGSRRS